MCVDEIIGLIYQISKFIHNIQILELTFNRINDDSKDLLFKCNSISTFYYNELLSEKYLSDVVNPQQISKKIYTILLFK